MPNRILTSIADLFARGLEALVSFFYSGQSRHTSLKDIINERLSQNGEAATTRAINEFGRRVNQAEIAADILSQRGQVSESSIPRAPGKSFLDPDSLTEGDAETYVVIETTEGGFGGSIGVNVFHDVNATWEQIKQQALEAALRVGGNSAKYNKLVREIEDGEDNIKITPIRTFRP